MVSKEVFIREKEKGFEEKEMVILDYLTFTFRYLTREFESFEYLISLFEILKLDITDFKISDRAKNHYSVSYTWGDKAYVTISVAFVNPTEKEKYLTKEQIKKNKKSDLAEVNISLSGQGCNNFKHLSIENETVFEMLIRLKDDKRLFTSKKNKERLTFTRIDFTKDDIYERFSVPLIAEKILRDEVVTRLSLDNLKVFSGIDENKKMEIQTLYLGDKKSGDFFIRIYNKSLERKSKGFDTDDKITRVEMVFRRDQAHALSKLLFECHENDGNFGRLYGGILKNKIWFLEDGFSKKNDSKTNNRHRFEPWEKFCSSDKRIRLGITEEVSTIEDKQKFRENLGRPLHTLLMAEGEDEFFRSLIGILRRNSCEMKKEDEIEIKKYWKEKEPTLTGSVLEERMKKQKEKNDEVLTELYQRFNGYY